MKFNTSVYPAEYKNAVNEKTRDVHHISISILRATTNEDFRDLTPVHLFVDFFDRNTNSDELESAVDLCARCFNQLIHGGNPKTEQGVIRYYLKK